MKKTNQGFRVLIAVVFANLSACGYIKSWFPDKEKDYQYTTEIAPLAVPPGLTDNPAFKTAKTSSEADRTENNNQITEESTREEIKPPEEGQIESAIETPETTAPSAGAQEVQPADGESEEKSPALDQTVEETSSEADSTAAEQPEKKQSQEDAIPVELIIYDDGETRLRIAADRTQAWHMVGKALMRNSIEVTERNQEEGAYRVVFEPDEKPVEDGSLWDEAVFLFKGFQSKGKPFLLKIIENNQQSDVAVLDDNGKPASDKAALRMLKLIHQTLKAE
ncbi:MAG: outer membrane protein assembly factor BamC [Gammaproteobacteria bacterium]